ncbi:Uncharacterized protein HZ326_21775 [Fusarium oxysporum f. sp. albedinis]|nr:Uncharacterized protein HZ326_21775 [Fusarium oxysporum f. sp. albedinis]
MSTPKAFIHCLELTSDFVPETAEFLSDLLNNVILHGSVANEKNISLTVTENIILSGRAWLSSPSFSGYKNNIVIRENGAIPSRQSNMDKPRFRAVLDQS